MPQNYECRSKSLQYELSRIAGELVRPGKGILASDEAHEGFKDRFGRIGVENCEETRRQYREVIYTASSKMSDYISGVILHPETMSQVNSYGVPFTEILSVNGIIPGVCVDKGLRPLENTANETTTQGLDNLAKRCEEYKQKGCWFTKWRASYRITDHTPSPLAIMENANMLAQYAAIVQSCRMVPIVEPDVSIDGDYDLDKAQRVCEAVITAVYKALADHHVFLEGTLLKTNIVMPGKNCPRKYSPGQIGAASLRVFRRAVPASVPGICVLSGGLSEEKSSLYLNAINKAPSLKPWSISFCFGRALQESAFQMWAGKIENTAVAQQQLIKRAKANSLASLGKYDVDELKGGCRCDDSLANVSISGTMLR